MIHPNHPPAVKVGGRRLSISKPRPHVLTEQTIHESTVDAQKVDEPEVIDYPRPTVPGEERPHPPPHHDEPKKEKHSPYDARLKELAHAKAEATMPTRGIKSNGKAYGANGRIAQPAGKSLEV
ncbi:hypothetical protein PLEOSDRAFT_1102486 [Pleurotus ostreatus PC15]|uniref:Uncharacterized protein n=1 Tax=Pleurotus ostreatus (strain PC15) TaxID=1137138 RepID=A0A067NUD0_PLEO1|nr:hypothetical protein PLEOSDRAFT_1102486 [Pleurotus ostreatus PC15]